VKITSISNEKEIKSMRNKSKASKIEWYRL